MSHVGQLLLDQGPLHHGVVLRRPSQTVKTGYVADIRLSDSGEVVQAHTPSLDCAGTIVQGRPVLMTKNSAHPARKTGYAVQHAFEIREGSGIRGSDAQIACHPKVAEQLVQELLSRRLLESIFGKHVAVESEKTFGASRVDFVLEHEDGNRTLIEVKNVVGADYRAGEVPADRVKAGVYECTRTPFRRAAIFPHGKGKAKTRVVSERAIRQVHNFTQMVANKEQNVKCAFLFVVNRSDCDMFRPCHEACELFAQTLLHAQEAGVLVIAQEIKWEQGCAYVGRQLPVVFDEVPDRAINHAWLSDVLDAARVSKGGRLPANWTPRSDILNARKPRKRTLPIEPA
eukprot:jgi/Ulvmu1/10573/UM065_0027.1